MQTVKGYLDNGRFIPYEAIALPNRVEATLLFHDTAQSLMYADEKAFWDEFDGMTAESADENELLNDEAFSRRASGRDDLAAFFNEGSTS